jgi:murein DD-endopeptidase MepM/ murein hydrolase activator NlpD
MMDKHRLTISTFIFICIFICAPVSHAATTTDSTSTIQDKIDQRSADIQALEKEISQYEDQINTLSSKADSLSSTIQSLDLTKKKLDAQISLTEDKISAASADIKSLGSKITDTEEIVSSDQRAVRNTFNLINQYSGRSLPEILLSQNSISGAWDELNKLGTLTNSLLDDISSLKQTKTALSARKSEKEQVQKQLTDLRAQLNGQKSAVASAVADKNQLLADTKQSQSAYQKILDQKNALKLAFEQEMLAYEQSLHLNVTKGEIPSAGHVLSYPLDKVFITQYFGNTAFSTANPQIYNGKGHTGVDFRASIGTPVMAALTGEVVGMGDTDIYPGCYSFGKWIMLKHPDGLSTLYAHLSVQSVKIGDTVPTGYIIGYSGKTGYATGPHLHFGVYATAGVSITKFTTSHNCKGATVPLADFSAYLNPLSYF